MRNVAILSLGLMGGSLGMALKRKGGITVHGFTRSRETGEQALHRGAIDHFHAEPGAAVRDADVVVCCAPILAIPAQVQSIAKALKPGAVVTDVGSTKAVVQDACEQALSGSSACFIGSHPIAGSEQQGISAARPDLYDGAIVVVTPGTNSRPADVLLIRRLWEAAGAVVTPMSAAEHDQILASTSHLPHMMASLLAATIGRAGVRTDLPQFCGAGYRDTTRIATGGTAIWLDILKTNQLPLTNELKEFRAKLNTLIEKLDAGDFSAIEDILQAGKNARQVFNQYGHQSNSED